MCGNGNQTSGRLPVRLVRKCVGVNVQEERYGMCVCMYAAGKVVSRHNVQVVAAGKCGRGRSKVWQEPQMQRTKRKNKNVHRRQMRKRKRNVVSRKRKQNKNAKAR